jgi:hypothetical protein
VPKKSLNRMPMTALNRIPKMSLNRMPKTLLNKMPMTSIEPDAEDVVHELDLAICHWEHHDQQPVWNLGWAALNPNMGPKQWEPKLSCGPWAKMATDFGKPEPAPTCVRAMVQT